MAADQEQRRIAGMRRGATTCAFVGAVFLLVRVIGPLLPLQQR